MIEFTVLFKIFPIFILAMVSPGPDFMIVSSMSLTRGRTAGVQAAAGIATVILLYTLVSLMGLSALFARYLWVTMAIKFCGGLYLAYLGFLLWRASFVRRKAAAPVDAVKRKNAYWTGALTCLTNPKAIAFFASIFALALTPHTTFTTKAVIGLGAPILSFLWFSFVAFGLSKSGVRARYEYWQPVIDRVTGTLLGFFGLKLILSERG